MGAHAVATRRNERRGRRCRRSTRVARPRPEKKKSEPAASATSKILPMELRVGDRLVDDSGEWEVIGRPYTVTGGKYARVRVQMLGQPVASVLKTWGAHERVSVKRTTAKEGKR
jgi:hypothetical protein